LRVHLVNPSEVSFGTAVITPRWLYVLAAATPSSFGDPCLVDETLETLDSDQIQAGDIVDHGVVDGVLAYDLHRSTMRIDRVMWKLRMFR